jgi:hypothetical protein
MERGRFYQQFDTGLSGGDTPNGDNKVNSPMPSRQLIEQQGQPEVLELLSILYDTYTLQRNLQSAAKERQSQTSTEPTQATERHGELLSIDPSFTERCKRGSLFVEAAVHIMRGSFEGYPEDPEYLRTTLNAAFEPYGFEVAEGKGEYNIIAPSYKNYYEKISQQIETYEQAHTKSGVPYENLHFYLTEDDTKRVWGAWGTWSEHPDVTWFVEKVNLVQRVEDRLGDFFNEAGSPDWSRDRRSENTAPIVPGLKQYYRERFAYAHRILNGVDEGLMRHEGLGKARGHWLYRQIPHINEALFDLDLHIDIKPDWQPGESREILDIPTQPGRVISIQDVSEQNTTSTNAEK